MAESKIEYSIEDKIDYQVAFLMRKVERLQELRKEGKTNVEVTIDHLEHLMVESIGLHLHLKRLEEAVGNAFDFTSLVSASNLPKTDPEPEGKNDGSAV